MTNLCAESGVFLQGRARLVDVTDARSATNPQERGVQPWPTDAT
jgi:hypothetical protein